VLSAASPEQNFKEIIVKNCFKRAFAVPHIVRKVQTNLNTILCWFPCCCLGASRGFAFVEFVELEDAKTWMDAKQV
jgi:hypothetical protein